MPEAEIVDSGALVAVFFFSNQIIGVRSMTSKGGLNRLRHSGLWLPIRKGVRRSVSCTRPKRCIIRRVKPLKGAR